MEKLLEKQLNILIGKTDDSLNSIIEESKHPYAPFTKNFIELGPYFEWAEKSKKPLLRDKWLVQIHLRRSYNDFIDLIDVIKKSSQDHIVVFLVVDPKDKFYNLERYVDENTKIIRTFELKRDIVESKLKEALIGVDEKWTDLIVATYMRKIGLNLLFLPEVLNNLNEIPKEKLTKRSIEKAIPQWRVKPIHVVLKAILEKDRWILKEHYELVNRYSLSWVINYYIDLINKVIRLKRKIKDGSITYATIRNNQDLAPLLYLVRDVSINKLVLLRRLLKQDEKTGIEMYLISSIGLDNQLSKERFGWNALEGLDKREVTVYE